MMSVLLMEMDFRHLAHPLALTRTVFPTRVNKTPTAMFLCHKNEATQTQTTTHSLLLGFGAVSCLAQLSQFFATLFPNIFPKHSSLYTK